MIKGLLFRLALAGTLPLAAAGQSASGGSSDFRIVFDSNRSGSFGIYSMNSSGADVRVVADGPPHEIYPEPSPDGRWVVFARAVSPLEHAYSEVWIARIDGSEKRRLARNGTFPSFSGDGQTVYFERGRREVMKVPVSGGRVRKFFPTKNTPIGGCQVIKPRVSPNGRWIAFISQCGGMWSSWWSDLKSGQLSYIGHGCEPDWFSVGKKALWVDTSDIRFGTGISARNLKPGGVKWALQDGGAPWGHEYFPSLFGGDKYLLYGACNSAGACPHDRANYQLFIKNLRTGQIRRITYDSATDRWPRGIPAVSGPTPSPSAAPDATPVP